MLRSIFSLLLLASLLIGCGPKQAKNDTKTTTESDSETKPPEGCVTKVQYFDLSEGEKTLRSTSYLNEQDSLMLEESSYGTSEYQWDSENKLSKVLFSDGSGIEYSYENGQVATMVSKDETGATTNTISYIYNKKGHRIGSLERDSDNSILESITWEYTYNDQGSWTERLELEEKEGIMEENQKEFREFDDQNRPILHLLKAPYGETEITTTYHPNGEIATQIESSSLNQTTKTYNEAGQLLQTLVLHPDDDGNFEEDFTNKFTYDAQGRKISSKMVNADGSTRSERIYEYTNCL